jgi:hypothetical protein
MIFAHYLRALLFPSHSSVVQASTNAPDDEDMTYQQVVYFALLSVSMLLSYNSPLSQLLLATQLGQPLPRSPAHEAASDTFHKTNG